MKTFTERNKFNPVESAKQEALKVSKEQPGMYVTICACFGLFVLTSKRLNVFAPTDSYIKSYWLNGKEKPFTDAQISADWNATPTMS